MTVSNGTLLGGRVQYAQPEAGYRTGIEPVITAACVPARPGDRVLEAGTGAGSGLLCLAARVPGLRGIGLERDAGQAAIARQNFAANGFDGLAVAEADILQWQADGLFDHGFANPPWHDPAGTPSPDPLRAAGKRGAAGLLAAWAQAMARALKPRATLTLILPAALLTDGTSALVSAECREIRLVPLWPRQGIAAKIIVLQGILRGCGACRISAGLVLHTTDGSFTADAEAILRGGDPLSTT